MPILMKPVSAMEKCFMDDDASEIVEKMRCADVIVFATPIYSNQMCGSMTHFLGGLLFP